MNTLESVLNHAKNDVEYPTTKTQLIEACNRMSDVPEADRNWFEQNLPDKKYAKPQEVFEALLEKV